MEQKKLLGWVEPLATFAVAVAGVLLVRKLVVVWLKGDTWASGSGWYHGNVRGIDGEFDPVRRDDGGAAEDR